MKKQLVVAVALLLALAIAAPVSAAVEFKYGGIMRVRFLSQYNLDNIDGGGNNHSNYVDQRTRFFFTFLASENLKLVSGFEFGNITWGKGKGTKIVDSTGAVSGYLPSSGRIGADGVDFKLKRMYLDFNIPCTPTKAMIGIQGIAMLDSWLLDDDYSAAVFVTKLDPVTITFGYVAGNVESGTKYSNRVDDLVLGVDYKGGPISASFNALGQYGRHTPLAAVPWTLTNPYDATFDYTIPQVKDRVWGVDAPVSFFDTNMTGIPGYYDIYNIRSNNLINLGANFTYKLDWMSAYVQGVKNLGNFKYDRYTELGEKVTTKADYKGWMIDAGANFFYGPYTFNITGFYTSGPKHIDDNGNASVENIDWFTYGASTSKYFSEIIGGGVLDNMGPQDVSNSDHHWRGYPYPTNLWTVSVGAAWQVLEQTKLSASYWYFGSASSVATGLLNADGTSKLSSNIGHELNFYVTQGIVDGLTLDLVAAYLFTGDAYKIQTAGVPKEDVYELGARLQWAF